MTGSAAALDTGTEVEISADNDSRGRCVAVPPAALRGIELPRRVLLKGTGGRRVVAFKRVQGPADRSVLLADPALCRCLGADGTPTVPFKVKASPAGILDVLRDGGIKLLFTVLAALIAFLATCASAFATFLSSELPTLAPIAFGFAGLTATIVLGRAIHAALKIEC